MFWNWFALLYTLLDFCSPSSAYRHFGSAVGVDLAGTITVNNIDATSNQTETKEDAVLDDLLTSQMAVINQSMPPVVIFNEVPSKANTSPGGNNTAEVRSPRGQPEKGETPKRQTSVAEEMPQPLLYVIGDSHGNANFLIRSLLATERFMLNDDPDLIWKPVQDPPQFTVVVLGDFIDRGDRSRKNAMLLKRLCADETWGKHLIVTLGNHESYLLRWEESFANKQTRKTDWSTEQRRTDLSAIEGEGHELITWLTERPVIYLWQGVLMMHGGLSKIVADKVIHDLAGKDSASCQGQGARGSSECGRAVVRFINDMAGSYYAALHKCFMSASTDLERKDCDEKVGGRPYVVASGRKYLPSWSKKGGGGGVLWFRGYTAAYYGAGTAEACNEANSVLVHLGAHMMVGAHNTHITITAYCNDKAPIFAVDTHVSDCAILNECDFSQQVRFHKGGKFRPKKENIPQALKVKQTSMGPPEIERCLSMYSRSSPKVQVRCMPF